MSGLSRYTGRPVSGWPHVVECVTDIVTTPVGSRVMRRGYGSDVPALIDMPLNDGVVLDLYIAIAEAIEQWEPRLGLDRLGLISGDAEGRVGLAIINPRYYPKGHLGDRSIVESPGDFTIFIR